MDRIHCRFPLMKLNASRSLRSRAVSRTSSRVTLCNSKVPDRTAAMTGSSAATTADFLLPGLSSPATPGIPRLGLGLAALGRPGYINLSHSRDIVARDPQAMQEHCCRVLDEAHALGIRYFDAARSYGKAELFLSLWLESRGHAKAPAGPAAVFVGSKWGYTYTADWQVDTGGQPHEVKEHSAANLRKQAAETQELLGSHLHLYQIHSATLESGVLQNAAVLAELEELKRSRQWKLGLSCSGVKQAETIRLALGVKCSGGQMLFDSVQVTWNLLEQSAGPALEEAHARGMSVIVKEGMANGRLLQGVALQTLQPVAERYGCTADALALAVAIAQPFKPMVLSGAASLDHIRSNAGALRVAELLTAEDIGALLSALRQDPEEYWGDRGLLAWN